MMSTCQNSNFTLGIGAPLTKFEFALRSPPFHHLAYGSSLGFAPNFLYNGAMGSHIESWFSEACAYCYYAEIVTELNKGKSLGLLASLVVHVVVDEVYLFHLMLLFIYFTLQFSCFSCICLKALLSRERRFVAILDLLWTWYILCSCCSLLFSVE
jgi:hypothetical protein